jgi:membrane fusion protein (multidrug efflux system)
MKWLMPVGAVVLLLLIIAWMAGTFKDKIEPGLTTQIETQARQAISVVSEEILVTEPVPATIGARQATTISSRTLARITRILVRAGDTVSKGQLLIELERSELESRHQQAVERVRSISARLQEAEQNLGRAEQLYDKDLVAAAALDEARADHAVLTADLANARQAVRETEVAISFTKILSPIDGRVVERFAEPGDTASPGDRLLALYNPLSMRVEAAVREGLAIQLELGQDIRVEIPVLKSVLNARIEELVPAANPGSRSFMVKAQVDYSGQLLPGMYARMLVPAGLETLLLVPKDRVIDYGQLDIVWVENEGQVDRRFIRTGREIRPGVIEVLSGLEVGEKVLPPP